MGHDQLIVLDGSTSFVTDCTGDCLPSQETGFFFQEVRHLSTWRLLADRLREDLTVDPHLPEGITRLDRVPVPGGHRNARGGG